MAVRARIVFTLVALSWESYSKSRCCYGNEGGKEMKMKLYVVVCYGVIFCHVALLFFYSISYVYPNYAEVGLDLSMIVSS